MLQMECVSYCELDACYSFLTGGNPALCMLIQMLNLQGIKILNMAACRKVSHHTSCLLDACLVPISARMLR